MDQGLDTARNRIIRSLYFAGVVVSALLIGCDEATLMKKFTPVEDVSIARSYVDLLIQGKFEQIQQGLDPSIADPNIQSTLTSMRAQFPTETPKSIKVVGANLFHEPQYSESDLTLEYEFPSKWLLVNVNVRRNGPAVTISGFYVSQISDSLENINRFTLKGKDAIRYSILATALLLPLFSLCVLVLCIRTQNVKKKWLWILFILVGLGRLAVNWKTGEWHVTPLAFNIPCASASAPPYGPWTVAVYVPLGAILFLRERKKKLGRPLESLASAGPDNGMPD
jgi:hypothetical protein